MCEPAAKKKPQKKSQDWEEAGSEFYQERYNAECDLFQNNSCAITTLLPSKQCRIGTTRKNIKNESSKSTFWQTVPSTSQKKCISIENYSSQIPDLSEVLTDEEHIWEQILQIKLLALSMTQKKELKTNLQKATKLRLQGFNQFKWKNRKIWLKFNGNMKKVYSHIELWKKSLRGIEGCFGTGVLAYFLFIRWLFLLNCMTFVFTFLFVILPTFFDHKPNQSNCDTYLQSNQCQNDTNILRFLATIKNPKNWKCSLLFYGSYNKSYAKNKTESNVAEFSSNYDISLAYILVPLCTFLITLIAIVRAAAQEFRDRFLYGKGRFFPYSCIIFAGWDFCIRNRRASCTKQKAISNEISNLLCSKRLFLERCNRYKHNFCEIIIIRLIVNVIIFGLLILSVFILYVFFNNSLKYDYVFDYNYTISSEQCLNFSQELGTGTASMLDFVKLTEIMQEIYKLLEYFFPYIVMVSLNIILPSLFTILCKFEKYSPVFVVKINLYRTVLVRLSSLAMFVLRIYQISKLQNNNPINDEGRCWETYVGQLFYMLAITDFFIQFLVTFCINFPRYLCLRKQNGHISNIIGCQDFELSKHVLDIVYLQTLCWLGSFYSPFLSCLTAIFIFFLFYVKKFQCLVNSNPSNILYGFTKSKSMFMLILLFSYFAAIIPIIYALTEIRPSTVCGPFRYLDSVWELLVQTFNSLPILMKSILLFFTSAKFAIPFFFILIILIYYFYIVSDANKNMVDVLRNQLVLEGHDKQFLLARLSYFFKYQKDNQNC